MTRDNSRSAWVQTRIFTHTWSHHAQLLGSPMRAQDNSGWPKVGQLTECSHKGVVGIVPKKWNEVTKPQKSPAKKKQNLFVSFQKLLAWAGPFVLMPTSPFHTHIAERCAKIRGSAECSSTYFPWVILHLLFACVMFLSLTVLLFFNLRGYPTHTTQGGGRFYRQNFCTHVHFFCISFRMESRSKRNAKKPSIKSTIVAD